MKVSTVLFVIALLFSVHAFGVLPSEVREGKPWQLEMKQLKTGNQSGCAIDCPPNSSVKTMAKRHDYAVAKRAAALRGAWLCNMCDQETVNSKKHCSTCYIPESENKRYDEVNSKGQLPPEGKKEISKHFKRVHRSEVDADFKRKCERKKKDKKK